MLLIIFSLFCFCGCPAGQCVFQNSIQVSILSSPARWFHLASPLGFYAFTSSHAALILAPLHSHQVKIITSNFFFFPLLLQDCLGATRRVKKIAGSSLFRCNYEEIIAHPQYPVSTTLLIPVSLKTKGNRIPVRKSYMNPTPWDGAFSYYSTWITLHWVYRKQDTLTHVLGNSDHHQCLPVPRAVTFMPPHSPTSTLWCVLSDLVSRNPLAWLYFPLSIFSYTLIQPGL